MLRVGIGLGPHGTGKGMTHEVYISYAPRDKTAANAVRAVLESQGLSCWIASRDLAAGADLAGAAAAAINSAKAFVLVFSANTNAAEDQIVREAGLANSRGVPLIGFRIADVAPNDTLKHFLKTHWIDAFVPPLDTHMRELADLILGLLGRRGGIVPTLKAFVPAGAPALKGAAALAKALPANLPNLPLKVDLKALPALPKMPAIDHQAIFQRIRTPLLVVLGILVVGGAAAGGWFFLRPHAAPEDDRAWQTASRADSVPAYQTYLHQFPQGYYGSEANTRLAKWKTEVDSAFAKAKATGTAAAYRSFLDSYSRQGIEVTDAQQGFAAADQREKAEHAAFALAVQTKTKAGYQSFLDQYSTSAEAADASKRMAACRSETRTVTSNQEQTLERSGTANGASGPQACSSARANATSAAQSQCSEGRGNLGGVRVTSEDPENDASAGGRRALGSLLGSIFNSGRSMNMGGSYRCKVEIAASCRKPVTATRAVDICP